MVCNECEKKLTKIVGVNPYRNKKTNLANGKVPKVSTAKNSLFESGKKSTIVGLKCKLCKMLIHQVGSHYCSTCAYQKGICAMCGKKILNVKGLRQSTTMIGSRYLLYKVPKRSICSPGTEINSYTTSINANTGVKSILKVEEKKRVSKKTRKQFDLPPEAVIGLRNAIITCDRSAGQLQNEADQLASKLENRNFPESPEKVKMLRDEIKRKLKAEMSADKLTDLDEFDATQQSYRFRNEVDKLIKKANFNWRPLEITSKESAASYALARIAANYAEISRCLEELPQFTPSSVLDYGSGSGAGFWAVMSKWPRRQIDEITMVDISDSMTRFCMDTIRKTEETNDRRPLLHDNVNFRRSLIPSLSTCYDLVIAHRVLSEIGSAQSRLQLIESLWKRTNKYLILIESAQPGSFSGILEARDYLLTLGTEVDYSAFLQLLEEENKLTRDIVDVVEDSNLSHYEKFVILNEKNPSSQAVPTILPPATVLAPCPHDLGCPMRAKRSCTFSARYKAIRADGRKSKRESDGTEVTKFTFVIMEKGQRRVGEQNDRILMNRKLGGHVTCDVCTAFSGIERFTLTKKKHGNVYSQLRSRRDGDVFPADLKKLTGSGMFNVVLDD
ncbi:unnamed protein product [Caenorhabditis bovis]|uniref:Cysteine-rich interactor of PDZ three n=1 Tax=Caenorhabditis bovis TaxID=2654633 RepID=A0A8S1ETX6_9PELO|nr:unnamed protein product [Caenorhabditis bovis]